MSNPDEAVALVIWREFLGDGDANATNYLVEVSTGKLYALDLDKAFMGIYPIKSSAFRDLLRLYATPARVEPVLHRIRKLTDAKLAQWLDEIGPKALPDWTAELRDQYLAHLRRNRDALTAANP